MADVKELHPALSFGTSCVLVGGLLYLLEASIGVTYSKLEEATPQFVALPVVSKPRNVRLAVEPPSRPLVRSTELVAQAPLFLTEPLLGLAASAERVSLDPEMQLVSSGRKIDPAHALEPPVLAPSTSVELVQKAGASRHLDLQPQAATNNDALQPAASAQSLPPDEVIVTNELEASSILRTWGSDVSSQSSPPPVPLRRPAPPALPVDDTAPTRKVVKSPPARQMRPMTLGPAESQATADQSWKSYYKTVWSSLARHKPAAGQRGSASVSFGINASGSLAFVKIAQTSGNRRIDQLAIATVRRAAPFPAPPTKVKARPYTIRIDFH